MSVLRRRDSRARALRARPRWRRAPTRIDAATRAYSLGGKELANVGRAYRLGKAAAETDVLDGRPFDTKLVGVGAESQRVLRIPVAAVDGQLLGERHAVQDRHVELTEDFTDVEITGAGR